MEPSSPAGEVYIFVDRYGEGMALCKFCSIGFVSKEFGSCCVRVMRWVVVFCSLVGVVGGFGRVRAAEVRWIIVLHSPVDILLVSPLGRLLRVVDDVW